MKRDTPRMRVPDRHQQVIDLRSLDEQLPPEDRVRQVWAFVKDLDVAELEKRIKSRGSRPGAPAISPRLLLALWVYACLDGVGSAREVARLCEAHLAYRWLCGGVKVNYHTLSDFRGACGDFLNGLLSNMIAALVKHGVVDGATIFQDGTKVRACAGSTSFRRESKLEKLREEAAAHVEQVMAQADDQELSARRRAARIRAARERQERVEAALETMKEAKEVNDRQARKKGRDKVAPPRASTTDADARVMKTRGGGRDAAYNVQFATDGASRAIVGVQVVQQGCDNGLSEAMCGEVESRTGVKVKVHVTDAGYRSKATVEREVAAGVERVMPLPTKPDGEPHTAHRRCDGPGVRQWRDLMQTESAKELMRKRSGLAETPNAELKTYRAMDRLLVRGLAKATNIVLLGAIVYNLTHFTSVFTGVPMPPR